MVEVDILALTLAILAIFGAGFAAGKYLEKSSNRVNQLEKQLETIATIILKIDPVKSLEDQINNNPALSKWMQENTSQFLDILSKMTKRSEK